MTWLKPGGYRMFAHKVSEYKVQSTAARTTWVPVKNSSIDQKTLLAVTNVAARPHIILWVKTRSVKFQRSLLLINVIGSHQRRSQTSYHSMGKDSIGQVSEIAPPNQGVDSG